MFEVVFHWFSGATVWTLLIFFLVLALSYDYMMRRGLPPGPYGLPFVGYIFFIDRSKMSEQMNALCQEYNTDILSVSSTVPLVIINTYELMKEIYQKRVDVVDRHKRFSVLRLFEPSHTGVISTSGEMWREARRFSISALRDFGMGRIGAENRIQHECQILNERIKNYGASAFDPSEIINKAVSNIICGMVFGQRFEYDDLEFSEALQGMNSFTEELNSVLLLVAVKYKILRIFAVKKYFERLRNFYKIFSSFVVRRIKEHREVYDGEVTDMIHAYLKEVEQGHHPDIFDNKMLESLIVDYFFAGSETTYSTLRWCLLAMAAYPDVQQKVQEELDEVIGDRPVGMSDKKQTPYTEAVLCEIQRHYTIVPLTPGHSNQTEEITINDYRIPRGAMIVANVKQIHHDPNTWKNPDNFDPDNFLENGKVDNLEKLVPFSIGRRSCAGEALARMELYIFFTSLIKEFKIRLECDETKPDFVPVNAGVFSPKPFKVRMEARY